MNGLPPHTELKSSMKGGHSFQLTLYGPKLKNWHLSINYPLQIIQVVELLKGAQGTLSNVVFHLF